ncbi:MAG TPA: two-component sensor histidine kinase [Cyanobacteria bacterium UBA8553]|nr:two-component sensor histidine kinase [Cyanobacteria bacterium UBA8553]HAJ61676.1 two-component sensor histidine kinase [Cyanobacteria bacterium UBA8543]
MRMNRLNRIAVRIQLTGWYVLLLALTLCGITGYLYFRLERKLMIKVDTALQIASAQSLVYLDEGNSLTFQKTLSQRKSAERLSQLGLAARLIAPEGRVVDGFGRYQDVPIWVPAASGYKTLTTHQLDWRLINQPIIRSGRTIGWLQVAQSLETLEDIARDLPTEILLNLPLILLFTALGGWFLSNRALRPIQHITQTAQAITASDLSQRIHYQGATDEVGQLAMTFDQMLERLQAAFDREQRFTADAAHELRTPLTVIKGQIEVTRSRLRSSQEYDQTLQKLEQEVDRLIRLTNGLLLLARIDQGKLQVSLVEVDLSNLLDVILEQLQPLAAPRRISLLSDLPIALKVQGDSAQLISLFMNLLDNAVKYTPEAGVVRIWNLPLPEDSTNNVQIAVSNTGVICAEHLPHLFERFYRVESARSQHTGGAGLGLAIAHEIARLHGGSLTVQSQPEQGTTFTVTLVAANSSE